ncbi:hypothetical protein [Streptomyces sp. NPDC055085]
MTIDWEALKRKYPDGYGLATVVTATDDGVSYNVLTDDMQTTVMRIVYQPAEAYRIAQSFTMAAIRHEEWKKKEEGGE